MYFSYAHMSKIFATFPSLRFQHPSQDLMDNLRLLLVFHSTSQLPIELRLLHFWITWNIWKYRNDFIFNKRKTNAEEIVDRSFQLVKKWIEVFHLTDMSYHTRNVANRGILRDSLWEPPPS